MGSQSEESPRRTGCVTVQLRISWRASRLPRSVKAAAAERFLMIFVSKERQGLRHVPGVEQGLEGKIHVDFAVRSCKICRFLEQEKLPSI